ncbi:MAG: hydrogenase maturation protease [Planctomycetes bacterium]|nr:hydrogenase maturation protease [Planctomycetota bacterium]
MAPRVVILGLGNPLARDEGLGPRAVERLMARGLPEGVLAIDAGTDFLAVLGEVAGAERLILIDAMQAGGAPGTLYRRTLDELLDCAAAAPDWASAHALTLVGTIRLARQVGMNLPPAVVFGVEPGEVAFGEGLTPAVEAALGPLLDVVLAEATA